MRKQQSLTAWYLFFQKNAVILNPFYARCIPKPQPQFQPGIKRVKDLAKLLRRPKSHAQATIACCLASPSPKNNAVILNPFYARCIPKPQPQSPPGIKRVKDLAELLRRPKSHAQATIACCLASPSPKKNAVILSPFYARCIPKPQPQSQPGIKRVKDLAELLRRPKRHAQATIACCLASPSPKKNAVILSPFYARYQRQATATIPAGHKKGEGSSRAFTPSKKPCARNDRLLLGIHFCLAQGHNVGARLDPSPFLSPRGMVVVFGFTRVG
jgi:hypothetical protein